MVANDSELDSGDDSVIHIFSSDDEAPLVSLNRQKKKGKEEAKVNYQPGPAKRALLKAIEIVDGWETQKMKDQLRVDANRKKAEELSQGLEEVEAKKKELDIKIKEVEEEKAQLVTDRAMLDKEKSEAGYQWLANHVAELSQEIVDLKRQLQSQAEDSRDDSSDPSVNRSSN